MTSYVFEHKDHLSKEHLEGSYHAIRNDVTLCKTLWYDGKPAGLQGFMDNIKNWWYVRVTNPGKVPVGVFWLNGYQGRTAQIHFVVFEEFRRESVEIGRATMQWLEELGWLHSVYGLTPATHRHVFPFIEAIGFKILGRVPGACWIERKQKHVAGVLSVYDFGRKA